MMKKMCPRGKMDMKTKRLRKQWRMLIRVQPEPKVPRGSIINSRTNAQEGECQPFHIEVGRVSAFKWIIAQEIEATR